MTAEQLKHKAFHKEAKKHDTNLLFGSGLQMPGTNYIIAYHAADCRYCAKEAWKRVTQAKPKRRKL